jgi:hypothetical protein
MVVQDCRHLLGGLTRLSACSRELGEVGMEIFVLDLHRLGNGELAGVAAFSSSNISAYCATPSWPLDPAGPWGVGNDPP